MRAAGLLTAVSLLLLTEAAAGEEPPKPAGAETEAIEPVVEQEQAARPALKAPLNEPRSRAALTAGLFFTTLGLGASTRGPLHEIRDLMSGGGHGLLLLGPALVMGGDRSAGGPAASEPREPALQPTPEPAPSLRASTDSERGVKAEPHRAAVPPLEHRSTALMYSGAGLSVLGVMSFIGGISAKNFWDRDDIGVAMLTSGGAAAVVGVTMLLIGNQKIQRPARALAAPASKTAARIPFFVSF